MNCETPISLLPWGGMIIARVMGVAARRRDAAHVDEESVAQPPPKAKRRY